MSGTDREVTPICPDCGAAIGTRHHDRCDVARCLWTGLQRLGCDSFTDPDHDCGRDEWNGTWPGELDAAALGWWTYWDGPDPERGWDYRGRGWVRVSADHPGAQPDLNRLVAEARWDREKRRWVAA